MQVIFNWIQSSSYDKIRAETSLRNMNVMRMTLWRIKNSANIYLVLKVQNIKAFDLVRMTNKRTLELPITLGTNPKEQLFARIYRVIWDW